MGIHEPGIKKTKSLALTETLGKEEPRKIVLRGKSIIPYYSQKKQRGKTSQSATHRRHGQKLEGKSPT